MNADWEKQDRETRQRQMCTRHGAEYALCDPELKLGIALATLRQHPINGLRHPIEKGTNGWYIWGGEYSADPEFFQPLCAKHLPERLPGVIPYLGLAPGWRFLLAPNQVEVWFDPGLLKI